MTSNDATNTAAAEQAGGTEPAPAGGFGRLSRTIRGRTTDLLAVAIVLVGGLSLGTQLVKWWRTDAAPLTTGPPQAGMIWGDGQKPVVLEFGQRPFQFERQAVTGSREVVVGRLIDKCAAAADEARSMSGQPHPAEERLLEQLGRLKPVRERAGVWQVFHIEVPLTLIVAVRAFPARPTADGSPRRVVCWGLAQPGRGETWITYLMRPAGRERAPGPGWEEIALPAGSRKILSLREESGGGLIAFDGEGLPREWTAHFNRWFGERNWKPAGAWSESAGGWSAAFLPAADNSPGRIDISIGRAGQRGLNGIISISPR